MLAAACKSTMSLLPRRLFGVHAIGVKSHHCADACCCLQVHIVPPAENLCRLRDILDLHLPPPTQHQASSSQTSAAAQKLRLHADLSAPDRCYAVQPNGGYTSRSCPMSFLHHDVMHHAQMLFCQTAEHTQMLYLTPVTAHAHPCG